MADTLTEFAVRNAKPRPKKYKLSAGRGLTLIVMPDGAKYWRLRYWFGGKRKELSIGRPYPTTSLKTAGQEADRLRALVANQVDPGEQRLQARIERRQRVASTFAEAANAWHEFRRKAWKDNTSSQVRDYLDKDVLPALGKRPLASITTKELASFTAAIEKRGAPDVAKKVRQWLASIYAYARAQGWTDRDPVRDLRAVVVPQGSGENYPHLPLVDLPAFLRAVDADASSPVVKGVTMLALWTANRPGVTRTLRWSEVDFDNALWIIERGREGMKRGYRHVTPLPKQAISMLHDMHSLTGTFEHVFIGRNDPTRALSDGAVNALLKRLGYRGKQTAHGFRHVLSTAMNELGYAPDWVERQLAHGDPDKIRGTYNKAMYVEPRRKMLQEWADMLDRMREGQTWSQVKASAADRNDLKA